MRVGPPSMSAGISDSAPGPQATARPVPFHTRSAGGRRSYSHFGDSIGTFAHIQFFQEPSSLTQAADVGGFCAALLA